MQGIKSANRKRKSFQRTFEYSGCQLQQCAPANDSASCITVGFRKLAGVQSGPNLIFDESAGDKGRAPESVGWATILG